MPIMSNTMPSAMKKNSTKKDSMVPALFSASFDR